MERYHGTGVSPGIAIGKIKVYRRENCPYADVVDSEAKGHSYGEVADSDAELARYERAAAKAKKQLEQLRERATQEAGPEQAAIFEVYQMILEDSQFDDSVRSIIRGEHADAAYAVTKTRDQLAAMFAGMDDAYMKERAADIADVSGRVLEALNETDGKGTSEALEESGEKSTSEALEEASGNRTDATLDDAEEPYILLAENLLPSETVQLDKSKVLAFVTAGGSPNSHVAILARAMGIPAVVSADIPLKEIEDRESRHADNGIANAGIEPADGDGGNAEQNIGIVDGTNGAFYLNPDERTLADMQRRARDMQAQEEELYALKGKETRTPDGRRVLLYANIGGEEDLAAAIDNDAEGIGLFRSEFLYLGRNDWPGEEEQFAVYKRVAQAMEGKRVIIRTMDIGADKACEYFGLKPEENPAMGCRGIRVSLARPEIFKTQLRAIFRAAAFGQVAVMYPMIIDVEEIYKIREIVRQVETELREEGMEYRRPEQGIMIETPAAALVSEALAKEVDFFSIGTNDLTQYTLAVDRQNAELADYYDAHHPAVLELIAMTVKNAHKAGIWVGICGELAADVSLTGEFLAMGIDELSVSPRNILAVRRAVREMV